jgi:hypothetical protein
MIAAHQGSTIRRTPQATRHRRPGSADCPPEAQGSAHPPCSCSAHRTTARRAVDRRAPGHAWHARCSCHTRHRSMHGTFRKCRTTRATASWCEAWSHDRRLQMIRAMRGSSRHNGADTAQRAQLGAHGVADVRWRTPAIAEHAGRPAIGWWHVADGSKRDGARHLRHAGPWPAGASREGPAVATNAAWISIHQIKHLRLRASHVSPRGTARYRCGADQHPPSPSATTMAPRRRCTSDADAAGTGVSKWPHRAGGWDRRRTWPHAHPPTIGGRDGCCELEHARRWSPETDRPDVLDRGHSAPVATRSRHNRRSACPGRHSKHHAAAVFRTRAAHGLACQPIVAGPRAPAAR